jgi:hypothetical protein
VCPQSKYNGVVGEVFEVEESSQYATVDMPKGTEYRLERIQTNVIIEEMKRREKTRKTPITRWPKGDPQWFPLRWLTVLQPTQSPLGLEVTEVAQ